MRYIIAYSKEPVWISWRHRELLLEKLCLGAFMNVVGWDAKYVDLRVDNRTGSALVSYEAHPHNDPETVYLYFKEGQ